MYMIRNDNHTPIVKPTIDLISFTYQPTGVLFQILETTF